MFDIYAQKIQSQVASIGVGGLALTPNVDGLITYADRSGGEGYTQLFRNGIVEAVRVYSKTIPLSKSDNHTYSYIPSVDYEKKIIESLERYFSLIKLLDLPTPIIIALSFTKAKGCWLYLRPERGDSKGPLPVDRLVIPEIRMNTPEEEPSTALKPVFDMVWNAFGAERSLNYDNAGKWLGP